MARVLLIENEVLDQKNIARLLKQGGHEPIVKNSFKEAIAYIAGIDDLGVVFDLILASIKLIDGNLQDGIGIKELGYAILQRSKSKKIDIVILSDPTTENMLDVSELKELRIGNFDKSELGDEKSLLDYIQKRMVESIIKEDWENTPDVTIFFGREKELRDLNKWIVDDHIQLVAILGMKGVGKTRLSAKLGKGGIGKTDLSAKLARDIRFDFEFVIWRSLLNAPPITEILSDLIKHFSNQQEINLPVTLDEQITRLLYYMKEHRCLLVLDNVETILRSGEQAGVCREGYEGYGDLFNRIGTSSHQSCLLINSREKPKDVAMIEGKSRPVRVLELRGLDEADGRKIFDEIGTFSGIEKDWRDLIEFYNGNPLALELVAKHIGEVFFGDISMFLKEGKPVINDLHDLLDWHFNRLSNLEKEILFWLAINREPTTLSELGKDLLSTYSKQQLPDTLQSLQRRVPLEKSANRFSLQPVLIEYLTEQLISRSVDEINTVKVNLLNSHSLIKALAKDFIREAQIRVIIRPIVESILNVHGNQEMLEAHFRILLETLRTDIPHKPSYAAGNAMNLLCSTTDRIVKFDFSQLSVWQAYIQEVRLHDINMAGCSFKDCVFTQTFGPISSIAISPDGNFVAASESSGDIHVWRIEDFQIISTMRGHINWIFALAFSPDGKTLASGGEDKSVRLWDVSSGKCLRVLSEHENSVWSVAFSPEGNVLASGSEDETVKIWNPHNGDCIKTLKEHKRKVFAVDFSVDGRKLASASADHTVLIWNVNSWDKPALTLVHNDTVRGVAFSPNNQHVASCSWDQTIKIWDINNGECLQTLTGHNNSIHSVDYNSNGMILVSSSEDGTIRIWDTLSGKCLHTVQRHKGEVWKVEFSQDGSKFASGGYDGTLRIWDTQDWKCINTLQGYIDWVQAMCISPDNQVAVGSNGDLTLRIWDVEKSECLETIRGHTGWTFSIAYSPDGKILVSGSDDRSIKIWDARNWSHLGTLEGHTTWVQTVAFSPDGQKLASGSDDRTVRIWDINSLECLNILQDHTEGIWSVAFSPNQNILISGSEDRTIKVWDLNEGKCINTLIGHADRIHSVNFSPDGKLIVSCSDDKTVKIWDFNSGECIKTLLGHDSWVISAAFSPDGTFVVSGGKDQTVRIWDVESAMCVRVLEGHIGGIWSVTFMHNNKQVASASEDGSIRLWDIEDGLCYKVLRPLKPYEGLNIKGVNGLTDAQKISLKVLGALE
jgi:WD40 repeat protein